MPGAMARGTQSRAPSQNAYKGSVGQTQTETVHVSSSRGDLIAATVHTTIDAVNDPELVERLHGDSLNTLRVDGTEAVHIDVPLVYHDPAAEVFALVLGEAQRHRELDERIRLLERLRADHSAVPAYVKEFAVVFGPAGLRKYLEQKAQVVLTARENTKEADRKRSELVAREAELGRALQQLAQSQKELERQRTEHELAMAEQHRAQQELERNKSELAQSQKELERSKGELERMRAEARARVIAAAQQPAEQATTIALNPLDQITNPVPRQDTDDIDTALARVLPATPRTATSEFETEGHTQFQADVVTNDDVKPNGRNGANGHARTNDYAPAESGRASSVSFDDAEPTGDDAHRVDLTSGVEVDDEPTGNAPMPAGSDPLTTETHEIPIEAGDKWVDAATKVSTSTFAAKDGTVRLALLAGDQIGRGLSGALDVRVLLHRVNTYPVVVLVIGPPAALRAPSPTQLAVIPLDIAADGDRAVLTALARKFEIVTDIVTNRRVMRRVKLSAPLAENVAYIVRAADDHLRGITADGDHTPSYPHARDVVLGAGFDLLGLEHAETSEFRDDKLSKLESAQHLRRAIAIARRFARPSREDYLVAARGFPLARWRDLRKQVVDRAVAWGIWMGPELAQVAVSEGLARSRRDLIVKLDAGFETLRRSPDVFDLDDDAADDNAKDLAEEARALGVELARSRKSNGAIKSEDAPVASGSIERAPTASIGKPRSTDELITLLEDKNQRMSAASELCDRGDTRAAIPVIQAAKKMSRSEAVRILGRSVKFGAAAAGPLMEGLQSSKAYLRHGCALALALLRTDEGTHAVIDQLLAEPTEIWREIARALGQVGPNALMPLAAHVGRLGERMTPALQERVAWAMAHIGVRGGKNALEQMAGGQSVMAPIARQALGLHSTAERDEVRVRPGQPSKDVTVNRAFSRRFFEALEADRPDVAQAALHDLEASGPAELLDEEDLIVEEDEDEAELDESDLIQS